jgi:hypothetical protein
MASYSIDDGGVSSARACLARDPALLHDAAAALSGGLVTASAGVGPGMPELHSALERFRLVGPNALDAVADASAALGGRVDLAARSARDVDLAVAAGLSRLAVVGGG